MAEETIREVTLRELVQAGSISAATAKGQRGGFSVAVQFGVTRKVLSSARGDVRVFPNLTTLASFLKKLGISRFDVDSSSYEPCRVRPPRPDRAAALRGTRTALKQSSFF